MSAARWLVPQSIFETHSTGCKLIPTWSLLLSSIMLWKMSSACECCERSISCVDATERASTKRCWTDLIRPPVHNPGDSTSQLIIAGVAVGEGAPDRCQRWRDPSNEPIANVNEPEWQAQRGAHQLVGQCGDEPVNEPVGWNGDASYRYEVSYC